MNKKGKLYVVFGADTEDNHPKYMPKWEEYGSNYDTFPAMFRFDWTDYWDDLIEIFREYNFPVTWYVRVDSCIRDILLMKFKEKIFQLKKNGDEIGIHIHTLRWNESKKRWQQTTNPKDERKIVKSAIKIFHNILKFKPISSRIGCNAMSNTIMRSLEEKGILYDSSAVPGYSSNGEIFGYRDNIFDWSYVKKFPYHPSYEDYRKEGNMKIIECPISTLEKRSLLFSENFIRKLKLMPFVLNNFSKFLFSSKFNEMVMRIFDISPHTAFTISAYWSNRNIKKIIDRYEKIARIKRVMILNSYFHPCDILNPKNGKLNENFLNKISDILKYLSRKKVENREGVEIIPEILSNAVQKYFTFKS